MLGNLYPYSHSKPDSFHSNAWSLAFLLVVMKTTCWLVERNFLVNKVTINSSKHVFLEPSIYKTGNKADPVALRSPRRCRAGKKFGSLKAN